jgi:hypothetical protein
MMWNPLKKKSAGVKDDRTPEEKLAAMPGAPKLDELKWHERFAMKRFLKMSPEEQKKVVAKAMTPENVAKHKDEFAASLEEMKKNRMISDDQYRVMKRKFGLK